MTPDQMVALLMEIADLRIRVANLAAENDQLRAQMLASALDDAGVDSGG